MKKYIFAIMGLSIPLIVSATLVGRFKSWNDLIDQSPDIVIAECAATLNTDKPSIIQDGIIPSEIRVLSVLKGNGELGPTHMHSAFWPYTGQRFLLFAIHRNDESFIGYSAFEEYRVVPLNHYFQTNMLPITNLQEQVRWVLQSRLQDLNEDLSKGEAEKKRLEEGLKNLK
jgi:hypothetical protein